MGEAGDASEAVPSTAMQRIDESFKKQYATLSWLATVFYLHSSHAIDFPLELAVLAPLIPPSLDLAIQLLAFPSKSKSILSSLRRQ